MTAPATDQGRMPAGLLPTQGATLARRGVTCRHLIVAGSFLLILPNALIAAAFAPAMAAAVMLGCAGSLVVMVRASAADALDRRVAITTLALCGLAALALCMLGGEGHFFFPNYDWLNRDAVLADLVRQGFPPAYDYQGSTFILRAPLAMYMLPAAVGRLLGLHAAHLALLAQNATLLGLMLALLAALAPRRKAVLLAVFITFSGVEILGHFLKAALTASDAGFVWPLHAHQHLAWWNRAFQYTNHIAQLFWVPNHAFPGWWLAVLSVLHVRREIASGALIVAFAFLVLWSPLTMAGALPIVGYLVVRRDFAHLLTPGLLGPVVVALCFLPIVAYLGADAATVPRIFEVLQPGFWGLYILFVLIQLPQAGVVALYWRRLDDGTRTLAALAIALLLLIPMYRLGANNDLAMRASILPLALLAFVFGSIVADLHWRDGVGRIAAIAAILGLGVFTPALEIQRALMLDTFAISDCNVLTVWHQTEPDTWFANYLARADHMPSWLIRRDGTAPPMTIADRDCWPRHPFHTMPITVWREPQNW